MAAVLAFSVSWAVGMWPSRTGLLRSRWGVRWPARPVAYPRCAVRGEPGPSLPEPRSTVAQALSTAVADLEAHGVPEAQLSAEYLLARAMGIGNSRAALLGRENDILNARAQVQFAALCAKRRRRMPLQYILGDWDFCDLTLRVEPPVLIPRPETEELVVYMASECAALSAGGSGCRVLDVGCGTGAAGLAILKRCPGATCAAIDVSPQAVALATANAESLGLSTRYTALHADIAHFQPGEARFGAIVANLPYIPEGDMAHLEPEVVEFEDARALCGGQDGLDVIRVLLERAADLLAGPGDELWLEVDPAHPPAIHAWTERHPSSRLTYLETYEDLGGHQRFCRLARAPDGAPGDGGRAGSGPAS